MTEVSERLRQATERDQIRRMRFVSLLEGTTLIVLLFVAVPLKHLGIYRGATSIVGPVHGLAFMFYIWMLIQTISGGGWSKGEIARLLIGAFIPFGGFVNERALKRRELLGARD
jgi:integral membrane protein